MHLLTRLAKQFTQNIGLSLLSFSFILLFLCLANWQFHRANEKKQLIKTYEMRQQQAPRLWKPQDPLPLAYEPITLQGHFLSQFILLDNQHENHAFGYHVLTPFLLSDHSIVLVNRGFIPKERIQWTRADLGIQPLDTLHEISGTVYFPSKQWILGPVLEKKMPKWMIVERLDLDLIQKNLAQNFKQVLHKSTYPFIIRLTETSSAALSTHWTIIASTPERHIGYAIQWIGLAMVTLFLYIKFILYHEK